VGIDIRRDYEAGAWRLLEGGELVTTGSVAVAEEAQ
jgi:hypothetical protein